MRKTVNSIAQEFDANSFDSTFSTPPQQEDLFAGFSAARQYTEQSAQAPLDNQGYPITETWEPLTGPDSVKSEYVFEKSGVLFVFSNGLAYVSNDNGASWTTNKNTSLGRVNCSFYQSESWDDIVIGSDIGIFVTSDNGSIWKASNKGLHNSPIIHSLAGISRNIYAATDSGVYVSINNGESWAFSNRGIKADHESIVTDASVSSIIASGNTLYATASGRLFVSNDYGSSWQKPVAEEIACGIYSVAVSGNSLWAGSKSSGVYISVDNGLTWTACGPEYDGNKNARYTSKYAIIDGMELFGQNVLILTSQGNVFKATDNGTGWTSGNSGIPPAASISSIKSCGKHLYALTGDGKIFRLNNVNN
jgi:photosystem II stability/assembly factor-like uncharacterized protein